MYPVYYTQYPTQIYDQVLIKLGNLTEDTFYNLRVRKIFFSKQ